MKFKGQFRKDPPPKGKGKEGGGGKGKSKGRGAKGFFVRIPTSIAWPSSIIMMMDALRSTIVHCWLPTPWRFGKLHDALSLRTAI